MKFPMKIDHALAVINLYFTVNPSRWIYEPEEPFGEDSVWAPDCVFAHNRKVYVCEVQLSALSETRWAAKWSHFNKYFNNGSYFHKAAFQQWNSTPILPYFLCITKQAAHIVQNGFNVHGRDLIVTTQIQKEW